MCRDEEDGQRCASDRFPPPYERLGRCGQAIPRIHSGRRLNTRNPLNHSLFHTHFTDCPSLQNIDSLEAKAGLSYGLGEWQERERLVSKPKPKGRGSKKGMSQKARGKQRAVEEESSSLPNTADEQLLTSTEAPPLAQPNQQEAPQLPENDRDPTAPQASTSNSPRIQPIDSSEPSQAPAMSLLFGGSSQLEHPRPLSQDGEQQVSPPQRKGSTPIRLPGSFEEFAEMYISPSRVATELPSTGETTETVVVPDSQDKSNTTLDTSALTNLSSLSDMSITDILRMPFCSQGSSVSDDIEQKDSTSLLANLPSLALTEEEQSKNSNDDFQVEQSREAEPAPKQITIQRFLTVPRVIPLHGTLDEMHCPKCNHTEPLERHIHILETGYSIHCPRCLEQDHSRTALGERSRGVGVLKVSVVLYGEEHKQASRVGEIAEKDLLKAARPDVLIVAGTTLRIPGVKKIVKELSKVIKQPIKEAIKDAEGNPTGEFIEREDPSKRVIFVNRDAPNPEKTWNEVFDTFVQGDAQAFATLVRRELQALKNPPAPVVPLALPQPTIIVEEKKEPILHVQTSLSAYWDATKSAAPMVPDMSKPVTMLLESLPIIPAAAPAAKSNKAKQVKNKQSKPSGLPKKTSSSKTTKKQNLLAAKAPSPQAFTAQAIEGTTAPLAKKAVKHKRPPIKSLAKKLAEDAARARAISAQSPVQPPTTKKEKQKPGWKGYTELPEGEELKPKFQDFLQPTILPEGSRRRRTSVLPPPPQRQTTMPAVASKQEQREMTPPTTLSVQQGTPMGNASVPFRPAPAKGSNWPASAHPSVASTPPSLFSDRDTVSDSDETASYKGEYDVLPTSQETACVPPSLSAEGPVAELPSSAQTIERVLISSPVIIDDSTELAASEISPESSSQSSLIATAAAVSSMETAGMKRSRSQVSPFLSMNQAIVKHASHGPSSSKRVKVEL